MGNKYLTTRQAGSLLVAVVLGASLAGCSSSKGGAGTPATGTPSATASARALPPLPQVPQNAVLVREIRTGHYTFRTRALASPSLTVQFACASAGTSTVAVQLFQNGSTPIYQIRHQPCDSTVQRITLTADSTAPIRVQVNAPAATRYGLLITQR